ncbi:MAG TPA: hypothetical protein DCR40_10725 [Prolixibacteraceae bacterium]|nr:hypothetical protein [Prolixibacteraceae bacterium]
MKKTIYLILVAFLIVLGSSKVDNVSAQGKSDPKKEQTAHRWTSENVEFELWCGDKLIDFLVGDVDVHCTMQYENGVLLFMNMTFHGTFKGQTSGEVFKYKEITKYDPSNVKIYKDHFNAVGDKGSHVIVSYTFLTEGWVFVLNKAICK